MNRKMLALAILTASATALAILNLASPQTAQAEAVVAGRDYQIVTAKAATGGESLYILDNKTGQIAVFSYDTRDRVVRVRAVRPARDAFIGR